MRRSKFKEPKIVLIFSSRRILIGVSPSVNITGKLMGLKPNLISHNCIGNSVMCSNFYMRFLNPKVEISIEEDLGTLDLIEYDKMCGVERFYYRKDVDKYEGRKGKRKLTSKQISLLNR